MDDGAAQNVPEIKTPKHDVMMAGPYRRIAVSPCKCFKFNKGAGLQKINRLGLGE
jgi:hypothetical protein